jgi:hypothetical protein
MEVLLKKDWSYTLKRNGSDLTLSVLCGTVGLYEVSIILNENENELFLKQGENFIDTLANNIRSNPESYKSRAL